ncbi:MAG: CAF17-like 4Fe-4S cluster assembly/insertion protein YgfZ [Actinomycetota bacterium]
MDTATTDPWEQVEALDEGRGSVDLSEERMLVVRGADARGWLGDLVTADIATLGRGWSRRSLLLTPTGRIRADLWIAQIEDDAFVVLQARDQPEPVGELLRPYVLSSAVRLEDATDGLSVLVFPARQEIVAVRRGDLGALERTMAERGTVLVDERSYEVWRVGRGDPRMGIDFEAGALPAEAGLERLIDVTKGCFLGQESVAKVRNLGHPPTVLRHVRSETVVGPGSPVHAAGEVVGQVTSAAPGRRGGSVLIARVEWRAANAVLHDADASPLFPVPD